MKTVICDIDGTIFEYVKGGHYDLVYKNAKILPGVKEKFQEWEVRTRLKLAASGEDKRAQAFDKGAEGLFGDDFTIAQQTSLDALWNENGYEVLNANMRKMMFPYVVSEAKELFNQFTELNGVLSG